MRFQKLFVGIISMLFSSVLISAPMIQEIKNDSDIGFLVVEHTDSSDCSLQSRHIIIHAGTDFVQHFLLHQNNEPSVIMRPFYYKDVETSQTYDFLDENNQVDVQKLDEAYHAWLKNNRTHRYRDAKTWYDEWIGGDIILGSLVEVKGYLKNLSQLEIHNNISHHSQWLSFSTGIFSRLIVTVTIGKSKKRGAVASIAVSPGEGGICISGMVERLP